MPGDAGHAQVTQGPLVRFMGSDSARVCWTHLCGVRPGPQGIWLYVNGTGSGDGQGQRPVASTGGMVDRPGQVNGAAEGVLAGSVDDVRIYAGSWTRVRVSGLVF